MTKDDVFQLMGTYYGNAYYKSAIQEHDSKEDLLLTVSILDQINALGYHISNIHKLSYIEDPRFLPIIFENILRYQSDRFKSSLLYAVHFRGYKDATSDLLRLYDDPQMKDLRWEISNSLFHLRNRKFIPEYLSIVLRDEYGKTPDLLLEVLLRYKDPSAMKKLLQLIDQNPFWENLFLKYAPKYGWVQFGTLIASRLDASDEYTRSLARRAFEKLQNGTEAVPPPT